MTGLLLFLFIGSLLQGTTCNKFEVTLTKSVKVMRGSCVTVLCSFDVTNELQNKLNDKCVAKWMLVSSGDQKLIETNPVTGDLTKKNCTTTFSNMQLHHSNSYFFRLDCGHPLRYNFRTPYLQIHVTDDFPSPILTPSTLKVEEVALVSLTCSALAPCLPHPPTLIWTPTLGDPQETLEELQDKTLVKISVLNFTASHLHHGQNISCSAFYRKPDTSLGAFFNTSLMPDILYSPKNVTVAVSPSRQVLENSEVTLTCSGDANPAVQKYTWYGADDAGDTLIETGKKLNITASAGGKSIFCKAENYLGEGRSNIIHIDVMYSPKNVTVAVSPSRQVLENSEVTLTCSGDANPAVQKYTWYGADDAGDTLIETGKILNITASAGGKSIFCKAENYHGEARSNISHIDVMFPSRILLSSKCIKTSNEVKCSCETMGNPSPITYWYLNGQPVNQSSQMVVTNESLNSSHLRSIISMNEPQDRDLSTLLCFSFNSFGSASKMFCISCLDNSRENKGQIPMSIFIATVVAFLLIVCALLVVVGFQKNHYNPKSVTADIGTVAGPHVLKELNEAEKSKPSKGTDLNCASVPSSSISEEISKYSGDRSEHVEYADLNWTQNRKTKKEENYINMNPSTGSSMGDKGECLYAIVKTRNARNEVEVKFKSKSQTYE